MRLRSSRSFADNTTFGHGTFNIRNVSVLPQGVGAYAALRYMTPDAFLPDTSCCIVDCGWATTDTLVSSPSFRIDPNALVAWLGEPRSYCATSANSYNATIKDVSANLDRIDRAIVNGKPLIHNGREIDLSPYLNMRLHVTIPIARSVLTTIKTQEDLTVFAAGGAAHYYLPALQETLGCDIKVVDNPRFANAIGFLLAGEAACKGR